MEDGVEGGRPFKDRDYILYPEGEGYILADSERYAIAISNAGENTQYAAQLLSITNQVLDQPKFQEEERNKLRTYELTNSGVISPSPPREWLKYLLSVIPMLVGIGVVFLRRNMKPKAHVKTSTDSKARQIVNITNLTINNIGLSQDLDEAAPQILKLIDQLKVNGVDERQAQLEVAEKLAESAQESSNMRDKLLKWGRSLADATISDVAKEVIRLAIRSAGIPLP
ncbi:hypothetical protein IQ265_16945 [Nodosilinea sp. LEGE 06152]|uniref:hypothetical protein n=1 Tax=Nodosilinea sp. LEGE 06152 TaxID=2777966 RepID=UPI00187F1DE0|nr:hypothetical protein [Nodosilinea sp. LEGE 06152]MBE9158507.1 hypothetical protein [Nodosilinea sp. LEGE 06152]